MKLKKNDTVKILTGKDKGKTGRVIKVFPKKNKILIEGLNLYKKHVRPKQEGEKGQIVLVPRPIDVSNALLICPVCKYATKVGYRLGDKIKQRFCKKCKAILS